jgi:chromosome partitioning protein
VDPHIIPRAASFMRQISLENIELNGPVIEREPTSPAARAMLDLSRSLITAYDIHLAGLLPYVAARRLGRKPATLKETAA